MYSTNPHQVCLHWHCHSSVYLPCSLFLILKGFEIQTLYSSQSLICPITDRLIIDGLLLHSKEALLSQQTGSEINRTFAIGCWLFVDYLVCVKEHVRNDMAAMAPYSCPGSHSVDEVYLCIFTFIQVSPHVVALMLSYSSETDVDSQPVTCMRKRETHSGK